jgi:Concanavalin A-like lectin/glucanases superfamily
VSASNTVPTEPPPVPPAQPGLVAAYGFNEGVGVLTLDSSGQANTGTIAGATWTTNGRFGSGLSFNGTNAWVTIDDSPSLDLTDGLTIEAWVNPSSGTGTRTVLMKEAFSGLAYALYSTVGGQRPVGYVHTRRDASAVGSTAVPLNTWTHLAFTFDGSTLRLYMNGTLVRTSSANGSSSGAIITSAGALRIGGNAVFGEYFRGIIDEVRVYNRPLSAADIQVDMNTPIQ